jgi:MFS transporter, YNFM family, putative membrane transport protein
MDDSAIAIRARALPEPAAATALSGGAFAVVLAGAFAVYATANAVVPIATELRAAVGLGAGGAGPFLAPFALGFGSGCVLWYLLGRDRPARLLLPASLAGTAAAGIAVVAAGSLPVAAGGRALAGAAAAGFPAAAQALIASAVAPERRGRMVGAFVMAVVLGSFAGQALAGGLGEAMPATRVMAVVGVALPLACALVLAAVLPVAARAPRGSSSTGVVLRDAWPVLAVAFLAFGGYWMLLGELPALLRGGRFGLGPGEAGLVPLVGLLGIGAAAVTGVVCDRRGHRAAMTGTLCAGAAGLVLTLPSGGLVLFTAAFGLFAAGYWGYLPAAAAETVARVRAIDRQGAMMALYAAMWGGAGLASAAGPALGGWTAVVAAALCCQAAAIVIAATTFTRGGDA